MDLKPIKWNKAYNLDIKIVDDQHKHYVEILNELNSVIYEKEKGTKVENIFEKLISYSKLHFATEEKYFEKFHYPDKKEHIEKHREFEQKILDLKEKLHENEHRISFELIDYLEDWLLDHIMTMDKKYVECFHKHGLY